MKEKKPIWYDYIEWNYSDWDPVTDYPTINGVRKGTPKVIARRFRRDVKKNGGKNFDLY